MNFTCCVCHRIVATNGVDWYLINLQKCGKGSPEAMWAHGPCLRKVMPVVGIDISGAESK